MVKIPIIMGESPRATYAKYTEGLRYLLWALPKTKLPCALTLRVVAAFAQAKADFVFDEVPVQANDLLEFQRKSDVLHKRALTLPRSFSRALLHRPLRLGVHAPRRGHRHVVRYVNYIVTPLNGRIEYASRLLRRVPSGSSPSDLPYADAHSLYAWLDHWTLALLLPRPDVQRAPINTVVRRRSAVGASVTLVSDGAQEAQTLGIRVVLADDAGVMATAHAQAEEGDPYSWAAEWLGPLLGVWLLRHLRISGCIAVYAAADNAHATTPSASPLVDRLRVRYAKLTHSHKAEELSFLVQDLAEPAQPCGRAQVDGHHRRAHHLATSAVSHAQRAVAPFADEVGPASFVAADGRPSLRHSQAMERRYDALAPPIPHLDTLLGYDPKAAGSWERLVLEAHVSTYAHTPTT